MEPMLKSEYSSPEFSVEKELAIFWQIDY